MNLQETAWLTVQATSQRQEPISETQVYTNKKLMTALILSSRVPNTPRASNAHIT